MSKKQGGQKYEDKPGTVVDKEEINRQQHNKEEQVWSERILIEFEPVKTNHSEANDAVVR